jgi:hypothetical protein
MDELEQQLKELSVKIADGTISKESADAKIAALVKKMKRPSTACRAGLCTHKYLSRTFTYQGRECIVSMLAPLTPDEDRALFVHDEEDSDKEDAYDPNRVPLVVKFFGDWSNKYGFSLDDDHAIYKTTEKKFCIEDAFGDKYASVGEYKALYDYYKKRWCTVRCTVVNPATRVTANVVLLLSVESEEVDEESECPSAIKGFTKWADTFGLVLEGVPVFAHTGTTESFTVNGKSHALMSGAYAASATEPARYSRSLELMQRQDEKFKSAQLFYREYKSKTEIK